MDSNTDDANMIKNSVMDHLVTDLSFDKLLQADSNVFINYRYFYEPENLKEISNNPVRPQFLRVFCFMLCAYAKEKLV